MHLWVTFSFLPTCQSEWMYKITPWSVLGNSIDWIRCVWGSLRLTSITERAGGHPISLWMWQPPGSQPVIDPPLPLWGIVGWKCLQSDGVQDSTVDQDLAGYLLPLSVSLCVHYKCFSLCLQSKEVGLQLQEDLMKVLNELYTVRHQ